jgi:hypothetical protein
MLRIRSRLLFACCSASTGHDEHVALHALAAGGREPVGASALDQLDEVELALRQPLLQELALVGRVDGDRADGLARGGGRDGDGGEDGSEEDRSDSETTGHGNRQAQKCALLLHASVMNATATTPTRSCGANGPPGG